MWLEVISSVYFHSDDIRKTKLVCVTLHLEMNCHMDTGTYATMYDLKLVAVKRFAWEQEIDEVILLFTLFIKVTNIGLCNATVTL